MVEVKFKKGMSRDFKNVKSIAKTAHNMAAWLDLVTLNGSESGPLELTKRQFHQIQAEIHQALFNLELAEESIKKYLKKQ